MAPTIARGVQQQGGPFGSALHVSRLACLLLSSPSQRIVVLARGSNGQFSTGANATIASSGGRPLRADPVGLAIVGVTVVLEPGRAGLVRRLGIDGFEHPPLVAARLIVIHRGERARMEFRIP